MKSFSIFCLLIFLFVTLDKKANAQFFYVDVYRNNQIDSNTTISFWDSTHTITAGWESWNQPKPRYKIYGIPLGVCSVGIASSKGSYCEKVDSVYEKVKLKYDTVYVFNLVYKRNCKYDSSIKNNTCPKCHNNKKVIPIKYGLLIYMNKKHSGEGKTFISAGCKKTCCDPHWYCKKDKIKF